MLAPKGRMSRCILLFGSLGAVVNFPEGYQNAYLNTSADSFKKMINDSYIRKGNKDGFSPDTYVWTWSFILNIWFIGYLIGTFFTPIFTERFGRKRTLLCANCGAFIGSLLAFVGVTLSTPELFYLARIVSSIHAGVAFGALILLLQEASPTEYRGMTSLTSENAYLASMVMGIGFGINVIFGKNLPILTGITLIPIIISILLVIPLKETPKFLLINRKDRKAAKEALRYYRGEAIDTDAILDEMLLEEDRSHLEDSVLQSVLKVLREPHLRTAFFIGCLALQLVVSTWSIVYLSTAMLEVHFPEGIAQLSSLTFIVSNFLAGLVGMFIIERFGRRTIILRLGLFITASLGLFILFDQLAAKHDSLKWGTVVALSLVGVAYGIGLGPIAYFITSELVAQQHRSLVQSMVFAVNTVINFTFSFAAFPAYTKIQSWSFIPLFIIPSCLSLIYLFYNMPETAGREIHEIVEELIARNKKNASLIEKGSQATASLELMLQCRRNMSHKE